MEPNGKPERRAQAALRAVVEGTVATTGEAFFPALVENLARALGARHALVAVVGDAPTRARTVAVCWDGAPAPNFVYELAGTPCEVALRREQVVFVNGGARSAYPDDAVFESSRIEAYLGAPICGRDGAKLGLLAVLHDAPLDPDLEPEAIVRIFAARVAAELERLRADDALRAERDLSRAILETSGSVLLVVDREHRIVYANERAAALTGIPVARLLGCDLHPTSWSAVNADGIALRDDETVTARVLATGERVRDATEVVTMPDGSQRLLVVNGAPLRGPDGAITSVVLSFEDVTARRALEEQLSHSQKMEGIGRLAGGVAHDFNNLLTVILSNAHLAEAELDPASPARELVAPIREAAQRASTLTRQLLAFARRQVIQPRQVDLNLLVRDVSGLLRRVLGENVAVRVDLASDLAPVRADPGQLEQVLVNLAVNARDAMPQGGRLAILTENRTVRGDETPALGVAEGDWVHLTVRDTGHGMDAETRRRAFEPFFTTKGERGTGLGLATCHGIVQQAGGRIWVESVPGAGTTFHVLLPRDRGQAGLERPGPLRTPIPLSRATILVVEDEEIVRATAIRSLERLGYRVLPAGNAREALAVAERADAIDLLLTDVGLPGMNGRELAAALRARRPGLRVLYASGYAEDDALLAEAATGAAQILSKPYTPDALALRVSDALGRAQPVVSAAPASSRAS